LVARRYIRSDLTRYSAHFSAVMAGNTYFSFAIRMDNQKFHAYRTNGTFGSDFTVVGAEHSWDVLTWRLLCRVFHVR
jgi:hypothetical protein